VCPDLRDHEQATRGGSPDLERRSQGAILSYIPVTVHVPQPPSPLAQELGRRIGELIEQFSGENPGLSALEIQQALQIGVLLLGVLAFFFYIR
jgi:hypothetical protein